MSINVLTSPWIRLNAGRGMMKEVSYLDLISGLEDAEDLLHPREDFMAYTRVCLSAVTQVLFPSNNSEILADRIEHGVPRSTAEAVIEAHKDSFWLTGKAPFLQLRSARKSRPDNDTSKMLFDVSQTSALTMTRHTREYDGLCQPCALMALYGVQAYVGMGGKGNWTGVRGTPPLTTLVLLPSVRATAFANTLSTEFISEGGWPAEPRCPPWPWQGSMRSKRSDRITLHEGLFWRPRALHLEPVADGVCPTCGRHGERLGAFDFSSGDRVEAVEGHRYLHPMSPWREEAYGKKDGPERRAFVYELPPIGKPVWTGLADMISRTRDTTKLARKDKATHYAAKVVQQWFDRLGHEDVSLLVFGISMDQAKVEARIYETWGVRHGDDGARVEYLRWLVEIAEDVQQVLQDALLKGRDPSRENKTKSYRPEDARDRFWGLTELAFLEAKSAIEEGREFYAAFAEALRAAAMDTYQAHTLTASIDGRKQRWVVQARDRLVFGLRKILNSSGSGSESGGKR